LTALGPFQIAEPPLSLPAAAPEAIDLYIVPGLCFSRTGDRIGYGKGFYDSLLRKAKSAPRPLPAVVAVGFGLSVPPFDTLPADPHDVRLDGVATETGLTLLESSLL